jgi:hypothetical protein
VQIYLQLSPGYHKSQWGLSDGIIIVEEDVWPGKSIVVDSSYSNPKYSYQLLWVVHNNDEPKAGGEGAEKQCFILFPYFGFGEGIS